MSEFKEFYVVMDGQTMKTVHPEVTRAEEERFRAEMRAGMNDVREQLALMRQAIQHVEKDIDHLRHVSCWCFALMGLILALCAIFARLPSL